MKVLIQGAGIAGLSLAAELRLLGIEHRIVERATELKPIGAGITLSVNALGCLAKFLDLDDLRLRGVSLERMYLSDAGGVVLSEVPARLTKDQSPGLALKRGELHAALARAIHPTSLRLGTSIAKIERRTAFLSNGEDFSFDLLVGADGIRSEVRTRFLKSTTPLRYSGYTCWRGLVHHLPVPSQVTEAWGAGCRLGTVPVSANETYVYATLNAQAGEGRGLRAEDILPHFHDFVDRDYLRAIFEEGHIIQSDIEELPAPIWGEDTIVLIGDAAHAMTPNLGQGAAMGIEDAAFLARTLAMGHTDFAQALREERGPRVRWVANQSRRIGRAGQLRHPFVRWSRDRLLRLTPASVMEGNLRRMLTTS
ncbi:MAG: FAD-dependent monooxygenase [Bdellovibrionaceae bacterium]|nr:FAD-dependent monooxygenase [Pseudobdellovibrionaceae bacterium]